MTLPLVILSVFAVGYGWVGIPEHFPGLGGLIPNWFHEFVGATVEEVMKLHVPDHFNPVPLVTSRIVDSSFVNPPGGTLPGGFAWGRCRPCVSARSALVSTRNQVAGQSVSCRVEMGNGRLRIWEA